MPEFNSLEEILDFAIGEEEQARDFYLDWAERVSSEALKKVFRGFAAEEARHKTRLEQIKSGKLVPSQAKPVADLRIADYLVLVETHENMSYQDALILAMKKEKAAFKLYSDLAASTDNEELSNVFKSLAHDEAGHKLRFEVEYDQNVLQEN